MGKGQTTLSHFDRVPKIGIALIHNKSTQDLYAKNKKIRGERIPLFDTSRGGKGSNAPPLQRMEIEEVETQFIIRDISCFENLNKPRMSQIKLYSSRSYAFSRSILTAINPHLPLFLDMVWISSWTMMTLSIPFLPRKKEVWSGKTRLARRGLSLAIKIFYIILYTVLQRLIGQWLLTDSIFLHLGTKVIKI